METNKPSIETIKDLSGPIEEEVRYMKVVAALADEAHAGQTRRDGRPYIDHPRRVRSILDQFGCSIEQKAIGLLHDVIEDSKNFNSRGKLYKRLVADLKNEFHPATKDETDNLRWWAYRVCNGVKKLSNENVIYESKRITQVEKIPRLPEELRAVKIIDQAASVIEDGIIHCDVHDWDKMLRERGFAAKGLEIAKACSKTPESDSTRLTHQCSEFYERVYLYFMETFRLVQLSREEKEKEQKLILEGVKPEKGEKPKSEVLMEQAKQRCEDFEKGDIMRQMILQALDPAQRLKYEKESEPGPLKHFYSPVRDTLETGLVRVTCSQATGAVVSYGIIVGRKEKRETAANTVMGKLREGLENLPPSGPRPQFVRTLRAREDKLGPVREEGLIEDRKSKLIYRDFRLTLPVPLELFIKTAQDVNAQLANAQEAKIRGAKAIDDGFAKELEKEKFEKEEPQKQARSTARSR